MCMWWWKRARTPQSTRSHCTNKILLNISFLNNKFAINVSNPSKALCNQPNKGLLIIGNWLEKKKNERRWEDNNQHPGLKGKSKVNENWLSHNFIQSKFITSIFNPDRSFSVNKKPSRAKGSPQLHSHLKYEYFEES